MRKVTGKVYTNKQERKEGRCLRAPFRREKKVEGHESSFAGSCFGFYLQLYPYFSFKSFIHFYVNLPLILPGIPNPPRGHLGLGRSPLSLVLECEVSHRGKCWEGVAKRFHECEGDVFLNPHILTLADSGSSCGAAAGTIIVRGSCGGRGGGQMSL